MEPGALLTIFRNVLNLKEADQGDQLRVIDLQVGRQVHQRVPAILRSELWKSVLHRRGVGDGYCLLYPSMLAKVRSSQYPAANARNSQGAGCMSRVCSGDQQGVSPEVADDIEKDVGRTFPGLARCCADATLDGLCHAGQAEAPDTSRLLCRFTCEEGKHSLQRVLCAYAAFDEEVNYCQVREGGSAPYTCHMLSVGS